MSSYSIHASALAIAAAAALSGCHGEAGPSQGITFDDHRVRIRIDDGPDAVVDAGGSLSIDGRAIVLDADQRELAEAYYRSALAIRREGGAVGRSAATGAWQIISGVFDGLFRGDTEEINARAHAGAARIKAAVAPLCAALARTYGAQNALAAHVPAFAPYTVIDGEDVRGCARDLG